MRMQSAEELRAVTEGRTPAQVARRDAAERARAAEAERAVNHYLRWMRAQFAQNAPVAAGRGIGYAEVYNMAGEYVEEGSVDAASDLRGRPVAPGLEEAWTRLRAELAPLGHRFARTVSHVSTGAYDTPYEDRTSFIVEWAAPWVTSGRRA